MCNKYILSSFFFLFVSGSTTAETIKWLDVNLAHDVNGGSFRFLQSSDRIKIREFKPQKLTAPDDSASNKVLTKKPQPTEKSQTNIDLVQEKNWFKQSEDEFNSDIEALLAQTQTSLSTKNLQRKLFHAREQEQVETLKFKTLVKKFNEVSLQVDQQQIKNFQVNTDNISIVQENNQLKRLLERSSNKSEKLVRSSNKLSSKLNHQQALTIDLQQQLASIQEQRKNDNKIFNTDTFKIKYLFDSKLKKANAYRVNYEYKEALSAYLDLADKNNFNALFNVANMIYQGLGVEANATKAFLFYLKAAKQGLANAQYNVALMLALGDGVEADEKKSLFWYKEAAKQGYDKAQANTY